MNEEMFHLLNSIYQPLCEKSQEIKRRLEEAGFSITSGFYNSHYIKCQGEYVREYFPIPVLFVPGIGDIGVDIDTVWVEITLPKEKAVVLDYPVLAGAYSMEVYGTEGYLDDFYSAGADPCGVAGQISRSTETQICVAFYFNFESGMDELIHIIRLFQCP